MSIDPKADNTEVMDESEVGSLIILDNSESGKENPFGHIGIIDHVERDKGKFDFNIAGDKQNSFSVKAAYDKTELGVVYFVPKSKLYSRITIHKQDKLIVVEYADNTHTSYVYSGELL